MNGNKKSTGMPVLLSTLIELLAAHRRAFGQERVYNRVVALVFAEIFAFARHTVTNLLLTLGLAEADWSGWYRLFSAKRFDEKKAAAVMLQRIVRKGLLGNGPIIVGFDGFHVWRSSKKMPGTNWARALNSAPFKPGIKRAQRFLEGSWFTPLINGYSRAIPLRCLAAFPEKAVASAVRAAKEWEAGARFLNWLSAELKQLGEEGRDILALADGAFDTLGLWSELAEGIYLLVRTARNRCLYELPRRRAKGSGRQPSYGPKAPNPAGWLQQRKGFKVAQLLVRGQKRSMRYRVEGPFLRDGLPDLPLFLIVIGGGKRPKGSRRARYQPCFYLINARWRHGCWQLPWPIEMLLPWLWQRWELEVAHRELKSGFGLGEKQCWHPQGTIVAVQWSVWVYSLLLLAGYLTWGLTAAPNPPGRWRRPAGRWSFNTLWRAFRTALWDQSLFQASWSPSRDNWPEKEDFIVALTNSVLAATRA